MALAFTWFLNQDVTVARKIDVGQGKKFNGRKSGRQRLDWVLLHAHAPTLSQRRDATMAEIETWMLHLHGRNDGAFELVHLFSLNLATQIIEFVDVLVYYREIVFAGEKLDLSDAAEQAHGQHRGGSSGLAPGGVKETLPDELVQIMAHPCYAIYRMLTEIFIGPGQRTPHPREGQSTKACSQPRPDFVRQLGLLGRGRGLWSLLGYAVACGRASPVKTLLRAGASPVLLRESCFELEFYSGKHPHADAYHTVRQRRVKVTGGGELHLAEVVAKFVRDLVHPAYACWILEHLYSFLLAVEHLEGGSAAAPLACQCSQCQSAAAPAQPGELPPGTQPRFLFQSALTCGCFFCEPCFWFSFCGEGNRADQLFRCPCCGGALVAPPEEQESAGGTSFTWSWNQSLENEDGQGGARKCTERREHSATLFRRLDEKATAGNRERKAKVKLVFKPLSLTEVKKLGPGSSGSERMEQVGDPPLNLKLNINNT